MSSKAGPRAALSAQRSCQVRAVAEAGSEDRVRQPLPGDEDVLAALVAALIVLCRLACRDNPEGGFIQGRAAAESTGDLARVVVAEVRKAGALIPVRTKATA